MNQPVTFSQCLEKGIHYGAWGAGINAAFGESLPVIASIGLGDLLGVTGGNYLVHNTEVFKDFQDKTKMIVVLATIFFTSVAVFGGFKLASRALDVNSFASSRVTSAVIAYLFGWGYVKPKPVPAKA